MKKLITFAALAGALIVAPAADAMPRKKVAREVSRVLEKRHDTGFPTSFRTYCPVRPSPSTYVCTSVARIEIAGVRDLIKYQVRARVAKGKVYVGQARMVRR